MLFNFRFLCSVSLSFSSCCLLGGAFTSSRLGTRCWQKGTLKSVAKNIQLPRKGKDDVILADVVKSCGHSSAPSDQGPAALTTSTFTFTPFSKALSNGGQSIILLLG